jgi:hypothetical protein
MKNIPDKATNRSKGSEMGCSNKAIVAEAVSNGGRAAHSWAGDTQSILEF